jgi:hypothetical protein
LGKQTNCLILMSAQTSYQKETLLQATPKYEKRRILRKMISRFTNGINPDEWNSYRHIPGSSNEHVADECRAIRFTSLNLLAITQPTGMHTEPNPFARVSGGIYFRQTSYSPTQILGIGEYLTWNGKCFTVFSELQFHSIYAHH